MPKATNEKDKPRSSESRRPRAMTSHGGQAGIAPRGDWPLARLRSEFDRLFDNFFGGLGGLPDWPALQQSRWGLDIDEQDDKIVVRAEAPGFEPDDFDIQVRDNQLTLCACQSSESSEVSGHRWEKQELYRSVPLPTDVDTENVDAEYHNGVLTLTLPKTEQSKARRISVKPK
jgi:HSP20 family protein